MLYLVCISPIGHLKFDNKKGCLKSNVRDLSPSLLQDGSCTQTMLCRENPGHDAFFPSGRLTETWVHVFFIMWLWCEKA